VTLALRLRIKRGSPGPPPLLDNASNHLQMDGGSPKRKERHMSNAKKKDTRDMHEKMKNGKKKGNEKTLKIPAKN
jgi:hypothetical protein